MMITSYVDDSPTQTSLSLEIPVDDVRQATDRTARVFARNVNLPGFRRGKVPLDLVKRRFAEELHHAAERNAGDTLGELVGEETV